MILFSLNEWDEHIIKFMEYGGEFGAIIDIICPTLLHESTILTGAILRNGHALNDNKEKKKKMLYYCILLIPIFVVSFLPLH